MLFLFPKTRFACLWVPVKTVSDTSGISLGYYNPFRYRGYYYDVETGLYYLQSRYYDANVGRFINGDDAEFLGVSEKVLEHNLFVYCKNDCVNHKDHTGKWVHYVIGAALGGILNVIFYIIDCKIYRKNVSLWKCFLNFSNGAINGLIAASGARLIWQIIAGIAGSIASLFIGASRPNYEDFVIAIICGVLSGLLSGVVPKSSGKYISYLTKQFGKRVKKAVVYRMGKEFIRALKYTFKCCKTILWRFIRSYCIPNCYINASTRIKAILGV